jgi:aryl-alcohol dehydrogenase-like predicted oxidoreductase
LDEPRRELGQCRLQVHPVCLGGNVFGWTVHGSEAEAVLDAYRDLGGNFVDTSNTYSRWAPGNSGGESERLIGQWMSRRGNRASTVVATKVGSAMSGDPSDRGLRKQYILEQAEASLRRLRTDYMDIYMAHVDDAGTPLEETLAAFDELVKSGKVRCIGVSNHTAPRLSEALEVSDRIGVQRYQVAQPRYNLVDRDDFEGPVEDVCQRNGLGVFTYSGLASGFLTGKYRPGAALPDSPRAGSVESSYMNGRGLAALDRLSQVSERTGAPMAQVALAWVLARPSVTATIASASAANQVVDLVGAASLRLVAEDIELLTER